MSSPRGIPYEVAPMTVDDLPRVMAIEVQAHPAPWPMSAYRHELERNEMAHYLVVVPDRTLLPTEGGLIARLSRRLRGREEESRPLVGYGGFWLMVGEAHISTVAIDPAWQRRGLGELLLIELLERAIEVGAEMVTLEVRISNLPAQRLYEKYHFLYTGRRRRYYRDNNEDAHIMTVDDVRSPTYRHFLDERWAALAARLGAHPANGDGRGEG